MYSAQVGIDDILAFVGRLLLASLFLGSAFGKITNFESTIGYMETHGMPAAPLLCVLAAVAESLGGVALLLGFQVRWGAALLAGYVAVATPIFHNSPEQRVHLLKNIAIIGGLLQIAAFGAGSLSLEGRRRSA